MKNGSGRLHLTVLAAAVLSVMSVQEEPPPTTNPPVVVVVVIVVAAAVFNHPSFCVCIFCHFTRLPFTGMS